MKIVQNSSYGVNLFRYMQIDFGEIIKLLTKKRIEIFGQNQENDLQEVKELRNWVMHHNFLIIDISKEINEQNIREREETLYNKIMTLSKILPASWNKTLLNAINKCSYDVKTQSQLSQFIRIREI